MRRSPQIKAENIFGKAARLTRPWINIIFPDHHAFGRQTFSWEKITFLDDPCCECCGRPFEYDQGKNILCVACNQDRPDYDMARSAMLYDEYSAPPILAFKHGGQTLHLDGFSKQLHRAGRKFWTEANLIIPVPLHPSRLTKRKFNQAALLARRLSKLTQIQFDPDVLFRQKATASQGSQTGKGRFRNVQGAFSVPDSAKPGLKGKTVVLVDDVMTTGATVESCARTLRRAGVDQIFVLALARVVRDAEIPT